VILLLDAHVLLWSLSDPQVLDSKAMQAIEDPANDVLVSTASIWELEIKRANGKLRFAVDLIADAATAGFSVFRIDAMDAIAAARLPAHHRDPFDRMLVAQAARLDAVIVSRDRSFGAYDVHVLTA
jgi:PIN domain nuclease of toxin-antitoxin system